MKSGACYMVAYIFEESDMTALVTKDLAEARP